MPLLSQFQAFEVGIDDEPNDPSHLQSEGCSVCNQKRISNFDST